MEKANPKAVNVTVLWSDPDLIAVDKPAGLLSHPGADGKRDNLADWMRQTFPQAERLVMQHRLDKDTSGLLLWSQSARACAPLAQAIAERRWNKVYLAWVEGSPPKRGRIDMALGEVRGRVRPDARGKLAVTEFLRVRQQGRLSLLELRPLQGRKHQLRVHLAQSGWPIVGDPLYGGRASGRLWLHAWKLSLDHPVTGQPLELCAPVPSNWAP